MPIKLTSPVVDWVRPTDWLTMPTVLATEEKIVGLYAVYPHEEVTNFSSNYIAIGLSTNYTVDWGDGVIENVAGNITAYHIYNYNAISSSTLSTRGYKQVLVTITPQVAGSFNHPQLIARHFRTNISYVIPWLDITISAPNAIYIGSLASALVERITILSLGAVQNFNSLFLNCYRLQSVPAFNTSAATNTAFMFANCYMLKTVPYLDTSLVTDMNNMFGGCCSLRSVPLYNTSANKNFSQMFISCAGLTTVPLFDMSAGTNTSIIFSNCNGLIETPAFNTVNSVTHSQLFRNCASLRKVAPINTSNTINIVLMFFNCPSIQDIPTLDFSKVTSASQLTDADVSLKSSGIFGLRLSHGYAGNFTATSLTNVLNNLPSLPTFPVTFTDTGDLVTVNNHGFVLGMTVRFPTVVGTTGITANNNYFIIAPTTNTFQISATNGGVALPLTTNGTGTCCINSSLSISFNSWIGITNVIYTNACTTVAGSTNISLSSGIQNFTFASSIVTLNNYVYKLNDRISFRTTNISELTTNTWYYVVNLLSINTFQLSLTENGTPITFGTGIGTALQVILGSQVTGLGSPITTSSNISFTASTSRVGLVAHGLLGGDIVSFPSIVTTTGISTYTPYYIVNKTIDNFQLALTLNGTPLTLTNDGTGTLLYDSVLVDVSGTASPFTFTMSRPMVSNNTNTTMVFRTLKTSIALFKNWAVV